MPGYCPRLIEVGLPVREVSAESVRDKSLRHGHISTLHLWWARRPLPASRAVVFASLVPDPDHENCPPAFKLAVAEQLQTQVPQVLRQYTRGRSLRKDPDPYRPYPGLDDTLRNRLLMFIAKWSPEMSAFESGGTSDRPAKEPASKEMLDDRCLVKWETSDPKNPQGREILRIARQLVQIAHDGRTPSLLDPFAGGGAIPLEAGRLGCQPIANDYNPVAYLILRATCEFPQKYGKPGSRAVTQDEFGHARAREVTVDNVLTHDFKQWAKHVLSLAEARIGSLYPRGSDDRPIVGYLWARTAPCSNPSCRGEVPLLRDLVICRKAGKRIALTMELNKKKKRIEFGIARDTSIRRTDGTMQSRGNVLCPFCEQITPVVDLRTAGRDGTMSERMVTVIVEGANGKDYRPVESTDIEAYQKASEIPTSPPPEFILPEINGPSAPDNVSHYRSINVDLYGFTTWGSLFNDRQLVTMETLVQCLHEAMESMASEYEKEYRQALGIYLGLWISRISMFLSNVGLWKPSGEFVSSPFSMQAIPMVWDYPEINVLADSTGSALGQLDWMIRVINRESHSGNPCEVTRGDACSLSLPDESLDIVVTDPPYFDAIAYADLSDYFYVWLKRMLGDSLGQAFSTPLTPKTGEATALKHRHDGDSQAADRHFEEKLSSALEEAKRLLSPEGVIIVMFAHQSSKAWSSLIRSLFRAGLTIDATWPIDTERGARALAIGASALASSITVVCRIREVGTDASFKDVRQQIHTEVGQSLQRFWGYGLRGADLIVACYGPAVGVFGRHERVEKADGSPVEVPELLELAREAARDAIAGEFRGDNPSTLYYVWANLYGSSEQDWDDARLVAQIGGDAQSAMSLAKQQGIFVVDGSKCRLSLLEDRAAYQGLGKSLQPTMIDAVHRAMLFWKNEGRDELIRYLAERDLLDDDRFWKLTQALFEVLPRSTEDWKLASVLLGERPTLLKEARRMGIRHQTELFE